MSRTSIGRLPLRSKRKIDRLLRIGLLATSCRPQRWLASSDGTGRGSGKPQNLVPLALKVKGECRCTAGAEKLFSSTPQTTSERKHGHRRAAVVGGPRTPSGPRTPGSCAVADGCNLPSRTWSVSVPRSDFQTPRWLETRHGGDCENSPRSHSPTGCLARCKVAQRTGRSEPRANKRRPKILQLLTKPRHQAKLELTAAA